MQPQVAVSGNTILIATLFECNTAEKSFPIHEISRRVIVLPGLYRFPSATHVTPRAMPIKRARSHQPRCSGMDRGGHFTTDVALNSYEKNCKYCYFENSGSSDALEYFVEIPRLIGMGIFFLGSNTGYTLFKHWQDTTKQYCRLANY